MPEDPITPPAGDPNAESSIVKQLRERGDAEKRRADELAQKLQDQERAKLEENDRLKLELQDRDKKLAEVGQRAAKVDQYETAFQTLYTQELAAVPEAARASVERLSKSGDWNERLEALRDARGLLAPTAPTPPVAGTVTQPTGSAPPTPPGTGAQPAKPLTPEELRSTGFGSIVRERGLRPMPDGKKDAAQ